MKVCVDCGKNLGLMEGYRHPIKGNDALVCSHCFDIVFESVERYRKFVSPYSGFFTKESSSLVDLQKIEITVTNNIKNMQNRVSSLWSHKRGHHVHEGLTTAQHPAMKAHQS